MGEDIKRRVNDIFKDIKLTNIAKPSKTNLVKEYQTGKIAEAIRKANAGKKTK